MEIRKFARTQLSLGAIALASILTASPLWAADLDIALANVKKDTGNILLALYNSKDTFRDTPFRAMSIAAESGVMVINLQDLPAGNYAVMLFQDLDGDEKLNTNLFGLPTEPWGGSLGGKSVFGPPDWKATQFELKDPGTQITIKLR